jgi:hypothetical protein
MRRGGRTFAAAHAVAHRGSVRLHLHSGLRLRGVYELRVTEQLPHRAAHSFSLRVGV